MAPAKSHETWFVGTGLESVDKQGKLSGHVLQAAKPGKAGWTTGATNSPITVSTTFATASTPV